ncbi:MAG: hypothetical protein LBT62_05100 [Deltaproteobacteria bacterium]|jgi:hypothetical protein|nr:hypothetical protein [Deltaproteobacteria bacterium]
MEGHSEKFQWKASINLSRRIYPTYDAHGLLFDHLALISILASNIHSQTRLRRIITVTIIAGLGVRDVLGPRRNRSRAAT